MKDREIVCKYYLNEGNCAKGREGTFRKQCQICGFWDPQPNARPARLDLRRKKEKDFYKKNIDY